MKRDGRLAESIGRFAEGFWRKRPVDRPPVGVLPRKAIDPIRQLRRRFPRAEVTPEDVTPEWVMTDYDFAFRRRAIRCDDWIAYSAAWRAIPWIEACCGCPVRYAAGSLGAGPHVTHAEQLAQLALPAAPPWLDCLRRETLRLTESVERGCWVSTSSLRGPSDVLAAMRGMSSFFCDLHDHPELVRAAAGRVNRLLLRAFRMHFSLVEPKRGGYGHLFGYWAPGPTTTIQEDAMGMCDPAVYRDLFRPLDAELVAELGPCVLFHLHSTGCRHWREVLEIPGLGGLELSVEDNGPPLRELLPTLREILDRSRLLLLVDRGNFEQIPEVVGRLPREGLYLVVLDDHLHKDEDFRDFVASVFPTASGRKGEHQEQLR